MPTKLKTDNIGTQQEAKKTTRRKTVSIDEKIEIFERFSKTKEELNGKTMFEGHPIGQWAILIRNQVNKKRKLMEQQGVNISQNLTEQQQEKQEKLEKLGILQPQKESKIDEKIQALIDWKSKYPRAKCYSVQVPIEVLKEYVRSEEEYNKFMAQYEKIRGYYRYVAERKNKGKLTDEQNQRCKKGNIGGVFEDSLQIEELSKKYRIHQNKIKYIIDKYGTMDNFITIYRKGTLDERDKIVLGYNLKSNFDVNLKHNKNYDMFIKEFFRQEYISEENLNLYDASGLDKALNTLKQRDEKILKMKYGLEAGKRIEIIDIATEYNITRERGRQIIAKVLRKLRNPGRESMFNKTNLNNRDTMTAEEQAIIKEVADIIFSSNSIFYPDKEYENEPDNINSNRFLECIKELERLSLAKEDEKTEQQIEFNVDTPIEELDLSVRTYVCLKNAGINTIGELMCTTDETLMKIVKVNKKERKEIRKKLSEIAEENQQNIDSNIDMDRRIVILNLSVRTSTCLEREGIDTIEKLVSQIGGSFKNLSKIRGLGKKSLEEIKGRLKQYGISVPKEQAEKEESTTYNETLIENLGFSLRAYNCLRREGIETIPELVDRIDGDFRNLSGIKNLGSKTIEEIKSKLEQYGLSGPEHIEQSEEQKKAENDDSVTTPENNETNSELEEVRRKKEELEEYGRRLEKEVHQAIKMYETILDEGKINNNTDFKDK